MTSTRLLLSLAVFLVCSWLCASAQASGFFTARFGSEHGHPTTDNATALFYNPAGLVWGPSISVLVDGTLAVRDMRYTRESSDTDVPEAAEGSNTGTAKLRNVLAAPAAFAAAKVGPYVVLGAGIYVPFGGAASWGKKPKFEDGEYFGAVDGSQRWHGIEGTLTASYATLGAGFKVADTGLSLGLTGSAVRIDAELTQAMTASFNDSVAAEGRLLLDVSAYTAAFGLGVGWAAPNGRLWLGASYQAPPGLWHAVSAKGEMTTNFVTGTNTDPVRFEQRWPDQLRAGLRVRPIDRLELRLFGEWLRWSVLKGQCIGREDDNCEYGDDALIDADGGGFANFVRRWDNAIGVRVGASYFVRPDVEAYVGAGYDDTAAPDATLEPGLFDGHDLSGTAGVRFAVHESVWLNASYTHQHTLRRDNRGRSRLADLPAPNRVPSSNGTYEQWIGLAQLILELRFDPTRP